MTALRVFEGRFGRVLLNDYAGPVAQHTHAEHQLLIAHDGAARECYVAGERAVLTREDIVFVNAWQPHETAPPAQGGRPGKVLAFHLRPEWLQQSFPAAFDASEARPWPNAREAVTPHIRKLADAMVIDMLNDRFLSADRLEFMVQELMLSIVDSYLARRRASSPLWRGSRFADQRIRRAIAILRARPNKDVNMDQIAMQVGLSRSRFYDLFQICTGRSPREYLDMLCVETAITHLSSSDTKIADVSAELGFSAQSNFTRFFLNQVGASPSEYRRAASGSGGTPAPAAAAPAPAGSEAGLPPDTNPAQD